MTQKEIDVIGESGIITESEIRRIQRQLRWQFFYYYDSFGKRIDLNPLFEKGSLRITTEQAQKGYKWLMNLWKTPLGRVRKRNPFHQREQYILRHFDHFELSDIGFACVQWRPTYDVVDVNGRRFSYRMTSGRGKGIRILH